MVKKMQRKKTNDLSKRKPGKPRWGYEESLEEEGKQW